MHSRLFYKLLANTLVASIVHFTIWFALTFYVYLQTKSVFATGLIAGIYMVVTAATGIWFGSLVDHHKKKTVMLWSNIVSLIIYAICLVLYELAPDGTFSDPTNPLLWVFATLLMLGVITGNIRTIAMPTLVTVLIAEDRRDKANGLVGTASGVSFLVTSAISGVLVAAGGMRYALWLTLVVLLLTSLHLLLISVPEREADTADHADTKKIDLRGTLAVISAVPGLPALIVFSVFNNLLGGVFMALMDAYGLSLMSVQAWGFLWGVLSLGMIIGGLVIAKTGLTSNPVRLLLLINVVLWSICIVFPLQASIILLAGGMFGYMLLVPAVEAAEQTVLQKVVPYQRQGRVFGFAQSVEQAASPLTAFLIAPLAQFVFIPFMTDGAGARAIGGWFGTGSSRGIALVFIITGILGLALSLAALASRYYRQLARHYLAGGHKTGEVPNVQADIIKEGLAQ